MPTEFSFMLFNTPGVLAELGNALGNKGINIKALVSLSLGEKADLRLVVDDADAASAELEEYGVAFRRREVLEVPVRDEPGAMGTLADAVAEAGGNIDAAYLTTRGTVILAVADQAEVAAIARRLGIRK
jgi:hypothetical protein